MESIKAIIVDDEPDARKVLTTLINFSDYPVDIIASCNNLENAVVEIKKLQPDVVFLDIQMPKYAGYEIVNYFDEIDFEIVFVTAFEDFALKAFELSAIDYLVKPINRVRLSNALKKISERVKDSRSIKEFEILRDSLVNKNLEKIVIPEIGGNRVLNLAEIICVQGQGNYSIIYLEIGKEITVSKNLKYFQNVMADNPHFFRSQKSWIINFNHLVKYNRNNGDLTLTNNIKAKISVTKIDEFEAVFKR